MRRECQERFLRRRGLAIPTLHHVTCVTHVPWCMPGSLTRGCLWIRWRGKRSRHSRRMRNPQFYVSSNRPIERSNWIDGPEEMWRRCIFRSFPWTVAYTVMEHAYLLGVFVNLRNFPDNLGLGCVNLINMLRRYNGCYMDVNVSCGLLHVTMVFMLKSLGQVT